ncbi:membrane protein insertion efficiency factor YidD [Granulicella sibirica]|nr:membrane protein insertion efficiency factor YidD [Granulicella sibirica]
MSADTERTPGWPLRAAFSGYKLVVSPVLHAISPTQCKFLPTCSEYAYTAMARHGMVRGTVLAVRRIARCHPFAEGGLDPVPEARQPGSR